MPDQRITLNLIGNHETLDTKMLYQQILKEKRNLFTDSKLKPFIQALTKLHQLARDYEDYCDTCSFAVRGRHFHPQNFHLEDNLMTSEISEGTRHPDILTQIHEAREQALLAFFSSIKQVFGLDVVEKDYTTELFGSNKENKGTLAFSTEQESVVIVMQTGSKLDLVEVIHEALAWYYFTNRLDPELMRKIEQHHRPNTTLSKAVRKIWGGTDNAEPPPDLIRIKKEHKQYQIATDKYTRNVIHNVEGLLVTNSHWFPTEYKNYRQQVQSLA